MITGITQITSDGDWQYVVDSNNSMFFFEACQCGNIVNYEFQGVSLPQITFNISCPVCNKLIVSWSEKKKNYNNKNFN